MLSAVVAVFATLNNATKPFDTTPIRKQLFCRSTYRKICFFVFLLENVDILSARKFCERFTALSI